MADIYRVVIAAGIKVVLRQQVRKGPEPALNRPDWSYLAGISYSALQSGQSKIVRSTSNRRPVLQAGHSYSVSSHNPSSTNSNAR